MQLQETFDAASQQMPPGMAGMGPAPPASAGAPPVAGGAMPAGPMAGAPGVGGMGAATPDEMMAQAEQVAMQLLGMPAELRRSQLSSIKKTNETLHALVIQKMDQIRQQAKTVGGYQALQEMVGGGGMM